MLSMIGGFVAGFSLYTIFMWISIMFIDRIFKTDKWYWEILTFILGAILATLESICFFILPILPLIEMNKRQKKICAYYYCITFVVAMIATQGVFQLFTMISIIQYIAEY